MKTFFRVRLQYGKAKIITDECVYSTRVPNFETPAASAVLELLNLIFKSDLFFIVKHREYQMSNRRTEIFL